MSLMYVLSTIYHRRSSWRQRFLNQIKQSSKQTNKQVTKIPADLSMCCKESWGKEIVKFKSHLGETRLGVKWKGRALAYETLELIISAISKQEKKKSL